jgi:hypothetical protein
LFDWQRLYLGSETKNFHDCCISGDGSLHRIRLDGTTIYYSRVTSPDEESTYSSWSNMGSTVAGSDLAIASSGASVIMVACDGTYTYRRESSDNGATWGSWVQMSNTRPCDRGAAIAFKPNGDCIIVHATDVNDPTSLYLQKRTSGSWSSGLGQRSGDWEIEGLAAYYDGDWNIIALVLEGNYLVAVRMVYGDGYRQTAGTWATDSKLSLGRAHVDMDSMLAMRLFQRQPTWSVYQLEGHTYFKESTSPRPPPTWWERHQAVLQALAGEDLTISGVSLVKPSTYQAMLCTARSLVPWIFRLKPGSDFFDYQWSKAMTIDTTANYGLALAADSSYVWACQANEVWRSTLPSYWEAPSAGSGAGDSISIPTNHILAIREQVRPLAESSLEIALDNSTGAYDSPGSGDIAEIVRGSRVRLYLGYKTSAGDDQEEVGQYFIESYQWDRSPGLSIFTLNCIDAWGLLERYSFNKPIEWNLSSDDYTVYELIEIVLSAIGATLTYTSRSTLITTLYPKLEIHAGESASSVLLRLLDLVEDVIHFFGLAATIVHPQDSDSAVYYYKGQLP